MKLPVDDILPALSRALRSHGSLVVVAPPGSGKTTRVPPALLDEVEGRILLLQPRRVAARMAARRLAQEASCPVGGLVGYSIRFERKVSSDTRIEVLTEGLLTRRMQEDPFLEGVGAVVLDEFHERSLQLDLALALVREVQQEARPDLKLVVMSATLDAGPLAAWLEGAPVLRAHGRVFDVDITHRPAGRWEEIAGVIRHELPDDGHTLVFLPGMAAIRGVQERLEGLDAEVHALHGGLPGAAQDRALAPSARRKVVLSTNIAETSVTFEGVRLVVDSGLVRQTRFDSALGVERLETQRVSQASATQRAGRAGRTRSGRCVRLWPSSESLRPFDVPAIHRSDLAGLLVQVRAWGSEPSWFEAPPPAALARAEQLLEALAVPASELAAFPLHPRFAAVLIAAHEAGCLRQAATAVALASEKDPFRGRGLRGRHGDDLLDRIEALRGGRIAQVRDQLLRVAARLGPEGRGGQGVVEVFQRGFPDRVARRRSGDRYVLVGGAGARLAPESQAQGAEWILAVAVEGAERGERAEHRIRLASRLEPEQLSFEERLVAGFDPQTGSVRGSLELHHRGLVLSRRSSPVPADQAAAALAEGARDRLDSALPLDKDDRRLLERLAWLRAAQPELELPDLSREALLPELCLGRRSLKELRAVDLRREVLSRLGRHRAALDQHAPDSWPLPSGSRARLRYEPGRPAVLSARIQQCFGMTRSPRVGGQAVLVELLAPNNRPQQLTADMEGFWEAGYPAIRKELRGRYPKWSWPERPTAGDAQDRPRR